LSGSHTSCWFAALLTATTLAAAAPGQALRHAMLGPPAPASQADAGDAHKNENFPLAPSATAPANPDAEIAEQAHAVGSIGSDLGLRASWEEGEGLVFTSAQKDFYIHLGGRLTVDFAWFQAGERLQTGPGGVGPLDDGADFRRGRLRAEGTIYEVVSWVSEFAFDSPLEGDTTHPGFIDVFVEINQLPYVGNFRAGHFREPFSMEALSSGNTLALFERSSPFEAFVPFRNVGMMLYNTALDERVTWASGVFRGNSHNTGNPFDVGDGEYSTTTRLTGLPWYEDEGRRLIHVGGAYSHRSFNLDRGQERARFRSFPEVRTGRYIMADTGLITAESTDLFGAEFALNLGPFCVQSEFYHAWVNDARLAGRITQPRFHGWYVQASYFLTGESRLYDTEDAAFDRPVPHENFFFVRNGDGRGWNNFGLGRGAWEAAFRCAMVDVNDPGEGMNAQIVRDYTWTLTWYLNPNTRVQWQYVLVDRNFPAADNRGLAHVFATRFHIDF
jgi:phosphate-selective porin OprO and OprP